VADYLVEIVVEFFKTYVPIPTAINKGKTELVFLIVRPVTKHVHNIRECFKNDPASALTVENFEDSVCKKWVLLLSKQTHLGSELFLIHGFDSLLLAYTFLIYNYYFLLRRSFFKVLFKFCQFHLCKPCFMFLLPNELKIFLETRRIGTAVPG